MLIVDSHLDLAWNALQWNRDLRQSVLTIRTQEGGTAGKARGLNTVALPELRQGHIGLCIATLLARSTGKAVAHLDYLSPAQAYASAQGQLAYYRALEQAGQIRILTALSALQAHLAQWEGWIADPQTTPPPLGIILSMESADPILEPQHLAAWWEMGVRLIGPAHYGAGRYAGGTSVEAGLSEIGIQLLGEMGRAGVILDMTHFSDQAFWQALDHYDGTIIASHNNCRALVPHQRQFSDEQCQAIIQRGGVIGVALDAWMLEEGWIIDVTTNECVTLNTVVDHIDHLCQLAGNADHVGIGSDLDGGFGREQSPNDLNTIADLQKFIPLLQQRNYSDADIAKIMHGNWLRVITQHWGTYAP